MSRVAANVVYCSPGIIVNNGVIEFSEDRIITNVNSLDIIGDEIHSTIFYNGIILPFKPEFKESDRHENIYYVLDKLFVNQQTEALIINKKINLYLLQSKSILINQSLGYTWHMVDL